MCGPPILSIIIDTISHERPPTGLEGGPATRVDKTVPVAPQRMTYWWRIDAHPTNHKWILYIYIYTYTIYR